MEPFRIGLAMAGAVSAGAYTAGVLDFLVQALDAWTLAKKNGRDSSGNPVPMHDVSLVACSGASAGSLCAAQLAVTLSYHYRHGSPKDLAAGSKQAADHGLKPTPLYTGWVSQIDIRKLFEPNGDVSDKTLPSLLNATVIDGIVTNTLGFSGPHIERPWVAQPLVIRMTVGNLRGVPYAVPTEDAPNASEAMVEHADHMGFALTSQPLSAEMASLLVDHRIVPPHSTVPSPQNNPVWQLVTSAARASSAFPLALPAIKLSRPVQDYNYRHEVDTSTGTHTAPDSLAKQNKKIIPIVPGWNQDHAPDPYEFVCVDGGVFNNEPFRLAHSALLLGKERESNPRDGEHADSAVVMIAPFNSPAKTPKTFKETPITNLVAKLMNAWIKQARFKPEDLALAHLPNIFSRFLISPDRGQKLHPGDPEGLHLASGGLGGFFGFFDESFREHDFQLGRRNCQRFLSEVFSVPHNNICVSPGYANVPKDRYRTADGELPIIPVMPELANEIPLQRWPSGNLHLEPLRPLLKSRLELIWRHYRENFLEKQSWLSRPFIRAYLWLGWWQGHGPMLDKLIDRLRQEQSCQKL